MGYSRRPGSGANRRTGFRGIGGALPPPTPLSALGWEIVLDANAMTDVSTDLINGGTGADFSKYTASAASLGTDATYLGGPCIDVETAGRSYQSDDTSTGQINNQDFEVIVWAARDPTVSSPDTLISTRSSTATGWGVWVNLSAQAEFILEESGGDVLRATGSTWSDSTARLLRCTYESATGRATIHEDGALPPDGEETDAVNHAGANYDSSASRSCVALNQADHASRFWDGYVGFILVKVGSLSTAEERALIDAYASSVWSNYPGLGTWTPAALAPDAWWRADNVVVTGSGVSTLTDLSGNGNHLTQSTDADRPPISSADADYGAQDVMTFDGVSDHVQGGDVLDINDGNLTIIVVGQADNTTGRQVFLAKHSGAGGDGYVLRTSTTEAMDFRVDGTLANVSDGQPHTAGSPGIYRGSYDAAAPTVQAFVNGTSNGAATTDPGTVANTELLTMGRQSSSTANSLTGEIAEAIVLLREPTAGELAELLNYVNTRYGLSLAGA